MTQLLGFDPLLFLGITSLKDQEKNDVSQKLLDRISQYIVIRISELLPAEDIKTLNNPEDIFSMAKDRIPDINTKVKLFLEDFRKDFYKNLKM